MSGRLSTTFRLSDLTLERGRVGGSIHFHLLSLVQCEWDTGNNLFACNSLACWFVLQQCNIPRRPTLLYGSDGDHNAGRTYFVEGWYDTCGPGGDVLAVAPM